MRPRKFHDSVRDEAERLRTKGEKWIVIEATLGEGVKGACDYRRLREARPRACTCGNGRLPCECNPDAWKLSDGRLALTEHEANAALEPGVTKQPLFLRGR